ncbi:MAG: class 3 adenylate cyclase/HAMP domain-containing protein [Candidatus Marinamargulisbacteria bacterium]|jgi:class 3 adenylate cyclase/HAMP domain-containing protein
MSVFKFKSIKKALLVKVGLVAIIPLLVISFFNYRYYRSDSISTTADIQSLVNENTSTKIHLYIMAQQLIFMEYAKFSGVRFSSNEDPVLIHFRLTKLLKSMKKNTLFFHLLICDADGNVLAYDTAYPGVPSLVGARMKYPVKHKSFYMSPFGKYKIGKLRLNGQYAVMPLVKSALKTRLYLVGLTELETIKHFMKEELGIMEKKNLSEGTLLLVDMFTKEQVQTVTEQKNYPKNIKWGLLNPENRVINYKGETWYGDKEIVGIGDGRYHLVTMVTKKDILFSSTRMLGVTLMIVLGALFAMGLTIVLIAIGFVRPIRNIGANLKRVAQGDYSGKIDVLTEDEFGQLSVSANQMTKDLKKSQTRIQRQMTVIKNEKDKSEKLLLNILPASIAARLKKDEKTIADHFPEATILFSDIVGFTVFSSTLSAKALVTKLNRLFSLFDDLLDKYHIEKIKTIGDALMLVSGVPKPRADHAEEMANMAFDMIEALQTFNRQNKLSLDIRIGIHTGPVVAGVIGKKKFVYDLWGDSVNTASRMESHGIPGCIQVSAATYEKLKDKFALDCRGAIDVKGKGEMTTYILKKSEGEEWDRAYKK